MLTWLQMFYNFIIICLQLLSTLGQGHESDCLHCFVTAVYLILCHCPWRYVLQVQSCGVGHLSHNSTSSALSHSSNSPCLSSFLNLESVDIFQALHTLDFKILKPAAVPSHIGYFNRKNWWMAVKWIKTQ
jgi:hypothetical protein